MPVYELARRPEDGQPFYTMRFIRGRTLTDAIRAYHDQRAAGRADPLERVALLNAFVAICNAVAYAHSRGVIHRDLKGQNVVLGDFGEVVVLDWGFAKVLDRPGRPRRGRGRAARRSCSPRRRRPGHTVPGQVLGTPAYMAPEQAEGRADRIDRRTDVYGLGAILYELLTGRPPFAGADAADVLRQVAGGRAAAAAAGLGRGAAALEAVCLRALARQPDGRYASAAELAREVAALAGRRAGGRVPRAGGGPAGAVGPPAPGRLAAGLAVLLTSAVIAAVVVREEWARNEVRVRAAEQVADAERKARTEVATAAYLKHIALAQEAVAARQLARADELLERCEPGLRDWEWHHLQRRTHRCLYTLRGHAQGRPKTKTSGAWCTGPTADSSPRPGPTGPSESGTPRPADGSRPSAGTRAGSSGWRTAPPTAGTWPRPG